MCSCRGQWIFAFKVSFDHSLLNTSVHYLKLVAYSEKPRTRPVVHLYIYYVVQDNLNLLIDLPTWLTRSKILALNSFYWLLVVYL